MTPLLTTSPVKAPARGPRKPKAIVVEPAKPGALQVILDVLEDSKAEGITTIDLLGKTSIADHMVIASGRSDRHVGAVADQIVSRLRDEGHGNAKVEGVPLCEWVLIDAGDIIVHVFKPDVRTFYNLEKMWGGDRPEEAVRR
ncbi:MAG: ribosome silencing factor [Beijerinckiaceae bacterium]